MAESVQIAVFEGGNLSVVQAREKDPEVVLALPLNRLLVKMVRVPAENREDPVAYATPILQAMSPYPDEPLTVTCETVGETEAGLTVIAAALPESAADDIGAALDAGKYSATRIDALALGQLRELWGALDDGRADIRRLVLLKGADCISLFVLDDGRPMLQLRRSSVSASPSNRVATRSSLTTMPSSRIFPRRTRLSHQRLSAT